MFIRSCKLYVVSLSFSFFLSPSDIYDYVLIFFIFVRSFIHFFVSLFSFCFFHYSPCSHTLFTQCWCSRSFYFLSFIRIDGCFFLFDRFRSAYTSFNCVLSDRLRASDSAPLLPYNSRHISISLIVRIWLLLLPRARLLVHSFGLCLLSPRISSVLAWLRRRFTLNFARTQSIIIAVH